MSLGVTDQVIQGLSMYEQNAWSILETLRMCLDLVVKDYWHMEQSSSLWEGIAPPDPCVFHPKSFEEAQDAIQLMKSEDLLLVNLASLESMLA